MRQFSGIKWILTGLLFLSLHASVLAQQAPFDPAAATYQWPVTISHHLTSTFAETRSDHFHAALDLKTWGQRGYPVYATRSGILHRIAIGPTGYGKILYLKHEDGSYSLYAHLMRFSKEIQQLADSIRFSNGYSASIDVVVDNLHINIEQGQQIALSGASGIGPPHLHFELRTPQNKPFNPLLTNLHVKDTIAPVFTGIAVEPLSIQSHIEGHNRIYTRNAHSSGMTRFGVIDVTGSVGLAVNVYHQSNGVHNVYAPYRLVLLVDGKEVFKSTVKRFSYAKTNQMFIDRVYKLLRETGDDYQRLYIADGNTLSFYDTHGSGGRLQLPPGRHQIVIKASDYYGNTTQAQLVLNVKTKIKEPLVFDHSPQLPLQEIQPMQWNWFNDWVNIPRSAFRQLTLTPLLKNNFEKVFYYHDQTVSINLGSSSRFYFRLPKGHYFISHRVYPLRQAFLATPDKQAYVAFPTDTFFDTTSIAITKKAFAPDSIQVTLLPYHQPIAKDFTLALKIDSLQATKSLAWYIYNPRWGSLWMLPTRKENGYLKARSFTLGTFLILEDTVPPVIGSPHIEQRPDGQWLVYVPVEDNRSGIAYKEARIYVNGVRGLAEYQPEDDRLVYYHPGFIPRDDNTLHIYLEDKMGNITERIINL